MLSTGRAARALVPFLASLLVLAALASPAIARGMTPEDVAKVRAVTSAEISPDGTHVAYVLSIPRDPYADDDGTAWTELHVADGPGASRPFVAGEVNVSGIAWTPDGRSIAYLATRHGDDHRGVWAIPVDGGESRKLAGYETSIGDFEIAPDGKRIAFLATAEKPDVEEKREKKGFVAEVVEEGLRPVQVWVGTLSADGPIGEDDVTALPVDGSVSEIRWSPDGKRLALAVAPTPLIDDEYMERSIVIVDAADGGNAVTIGNTGKLGDFRWSPDGSKLALISAADKNDPNASRLMVVPAAGGTPKDLIPGLLADVEQIAWKDDATIVHVVDRGTQSAVKTIGTDGKKEATILDFGGPIWDSLSLSADGARVAMVAQTPTHPGEVYVHAAGDGAARWTDVNPWLAEIDFGKQESIVWKARDGMDIEGILIRPLDETKGTRYPLIHVVHGGPEAHYSNGWLTRYSYPGQVGAAQGYMVLYANYRGSTGLGVEFSKMSQSDYAGDPTGEKAGEFWDLVDGIDHLVEQGLVDRDKVGITGGSYGGFASAWGATAHTEHYAAAVMFVGISDQISKFGTTDIPNEMFLVHARRWPWKHWQWFLERSPIYYAEQARTPILILHGAEDTRVHPSQSMELYRYLKTIGNVPVRLVLYPGEGHGNRKAAARYDYNLRLMRWMDHYLKGAGGDPPPYELDLDADKLGVDDDEDDEDDD